LLPYPIGGQFAGGTAADGSINEALYVYDQYQPHENSGRLRSAFLGSSEVSWQVIAGPERISTGEFLFVIKSKHAFGVLPELREAAVPARGRTRVVEALGKLVYAAYREAPGSVVDLARDVAQCCLGTWAASRFNNDLLLQEELGSLIGKLEKEKRAATRVAEVVRILHPRNKSNEQERYKSRPLMEDDAELAVKAVAFIIRELGWANE
jgi:hypothetical protein